MYGSRDPLVREAKGFGLGFEGLEEKRQDISQRRRRVGR